METKTYKLQEQSLRGRLECSVRCQPIPDRILYSAILWAVGRIAYEIMYPIRLFIVCDQSLVHVLHHLVPQCACLIKESLCATRSNERGGEPREQSPCGPVQRGGRDILVMKHHPKPKQTNVGQHIVWRILPTHKVFAKKVHIVCVSTLCRIVVRADIIYQMSIRVRVAHVRPGRYQEEITRGGWKQSNTSLCTPMSIFDKIACQCQCNVSSHRVAGDNDVGWIVTHDIHEMDVSREGIEEHSREGVFFGKRVCRREAVFYREEVWYPSIQDAAIHVWHERGTWMGRQEGKRSPMQEQEGFVRFGDWHGWFGSRFDVFAVPVAWDADWLDTCDRSKERKVSDDQVRW